MAHKEFLQKMVPSPFKLKIPRPANGKKRTRLPNQQEASNGVTKINYIVSKRNWGGVVFIVKINVA